MAFERTTMASNFFDIASAQLLVKPEPQYLYAQMFLGALGASLSVPGMLGLAGREINGVGMPYTAEDKDRLMLSNPMINGVIAAKVDFNGLPGSTIRINRPVFANTTYTEASRRITGSISTTEINVNEEQNNLTLYTYGGPYSTAASAIAPYAIKAFDANMGVHNAASIHGTHLKRDCHRFIDQVMVSLLDLASSTIYPEGMSAANDATATGSFPMTYEQIARTESAMDDANLPTFPDGFRALVLHPTQLKQLKDDSQFQRASKDHPEYNILFPQYVTSVGKFHIFKSTTLDTDSNSSSVTLYKGHAIAPGALLGGMGRPLHVAASTDDNYGETVKIIWKGDLAFGLADNSFCVSVVSSA